MPSRIGYGDERKPKFLPKTHIGKRMTNQIGDRWRHMSEIIELLAQLSDDNPRATTELTARVYDEIHRLAAAYMGRDRADHTLQTTALVHEAYLRLIGQRHRLEESRWLRGEIAGRR